MQKPLVSIIMGSDSDLPVMKKTVTILEDFSIPYDITIMSAHRTPKALGLYLKKVMKKGVKVIISGAGGAAHLPGVIASQVSIPVIGVPIQTPVLHGIDSLYSMIQMPSGVPVATVGINGAINAGLLAVQILSLIDNKLATKFDNYRKAMTKKVLDKNTKLQRLGIKKYASK